jgi:hypothetical protein
MKILLALVLTFLSFVTTAQDMSSISLIENTSYTNAPKPSEQSPFRFVKKAAEILDLRNFLDTIIQIDKQKKELEKYFPKGEFDTFVKKIIKDGAKAKESSVIGFYKYLGNDVLNVIIDRILETEGIKDETRRKLWLTKITGPYYQCINKSSDSFFDSYHCLNALMDNMVPNVGVAIVYELSKDNLNSALPLKVREPFNIEQSELYKSCIAKVKANDKEKFNNANVQVCALSTMKSGVAKVTDLTLTLTIELKASSPNASAEIKKSVWPSFTNCNQQVGTSASNKASLPEQFMSCIDNLVIETGTKIVLDKITNTPAIKDAFSEKELKMLAFEKSAEFKECAEDQKSNNVKKDGLLDIGPCENSLTNEITYKVVVDTLKESAKNTLLKNKDKNLSIKIGNDGVKLLEKCWNNKQASAAREACLRKTIVSFSQQLATIKLNDSIPIDMPNKKDLTATSASDLGKCMDKELPNNISDSNDLSKRLDICIVKLTKSVASKVASHEIRSAAKGNISPEATDLLVKNLVENEFMSCIGNSPTDDQLENCSNLLTAKAGKNISEISFKKEVNGYLANSGGLRTMGLSQTQVDAFLNDLNKSTRDCIDKKSNGPIMDQVNSCLKVSIKKIAFFFGDLQFNKSIGSMYADRDADKKKIEEQFKNSLSNCLSLKDDKTYTITDFTKNLYICSDKIATSTTLIVGSDQVHSSLDKYLNDRPGIDLKSKRQELSTVILGNFKTCMNKATNEDKCIDALKKEATTQIVLNYGRVETKAQINADQTPEELTTVENALIKCTDSILEGNALSDHLDTCTKDFALGFAKELGALKLNYLLKQALGTEEFSNQKNEIEDSINSYNKCLEGLQKFSINDGLTDKLSICTDGLTNRGMGLVRNNINNWMTTEQKDAATIMIKQEFANFLPCLSALIPASPYSVNVQTNIESSIKPIAVMLSQYIEYNPENAKETLDVVIQKFSIDFNDVAATRSAKKELLEFLDQHQALDQFIKAIVRGTVKDSLASIPEKDIPNDLRAILLKKENFEVVFNSPEGKRIKEFVMDKILKPVLLEDEIKSDNLKISTDVIKDNVIKLLINSPNFGEQAIKLSIQKQINDMNGVTKFFAKALYGGQSLNWDSVRLTPDGIKAEDYIKTNVLTPKFKGIPQTSAEIKMINEEAEKLVKKAVKSYG